MKRIKLCESEVIESNRVLDLPGGPVRIYEREVHGYYRPESTRTRLVVSEALDRTRTFISRAREEFTELNAVMRELVPR